MSNALKSLIENEKKYLEKLDLIDTKISPPWMKQFESVAPDFTELLKCIQDIILVNKPFYERLILLEEDSQIDSILSDLINGLQSTYKSYTEHIINNLNKRQDILCTPSIHQFLNDANNKDTTLESLFYAPLYQLNFYKSLFNRPDITSIHQSTINQLLDSLMIKNSLPPVDLDHFFSQLDCSKAVDILTETQIPNYILPTVQKVLLDHSFICTDLSKRVQLVLTTDALIVCTRDINQHDYLLYTPVQIKDISIRTIHTDRELIGEYNMQLWIQKQKLITLKSKSKQERNMWLGLSDEQSSKDPSWVPLKEIVHMYDLRRRSHAKFKASAPKPIRTQDIFTVLTDPSDTISPLVSSDDEEEDEDQSAPVTVNKPPMPPLPQDQHHPAATRSLPVRNHSLVKKPPIPSEFVASSPETMVRRPPNVRSLSSSQLPASPVITKKPSFMRSVMASFKPNKKSSVDSLSSAFTETRHNQSTPSFTSITTSSQSSLNMTPPLSRSSSPGSVTPVQRYQSSSSSSEDLSHTTPPESPDMLNYRKVLYSNAHCQVFHWKDESWYAVEDECILEVRQTTYNNRSCVAVHMKQTGQCYLNAWILPDTQIQRANETDINLTISNHQQTESYVFHVTDADNLQALLEQTHAESVRNGGSAVMTTPLPLMRSSSLAVNNQLTAEELAKTLKLAMQCKCKLYVQSASSKWSSFGAVSMKVSQQYATKKMHIAMNAYNKEDKQLVSAMVQSNNVERLSTKRISFLMSDDVYSVVYMIQVREEATADKIMEYIKLKNAENGW